MNSSEKRLVRRLRERDEAAFREMLELYQNKIYNLLYRMLGSQEEAEDQAQEVFILVFKRVHQFRGDSKFSTWLYRVAINHCNNRLKILIRRRKNEAQGIAEESVQFAESPAKGPDRLLEGVEKQRLVQGAIAQLEDEHRSVLVLRDIEELPYEEIAQILELAPGTVKSRLHRARLALRAKLAKVMKEGS